EEGVVRDDEVGAERPRLLDDGRREVEGDEHGPHRAPAVAHLEADVVVVEPGGGRRPRFERGGDLGDGRHGSRGELRRAGYEGASYRRPPCSPFVLRHSPFVLRAWPSRSRSSSATVGSTAARPERRMPSASSRRPRRRAPTTNSTITMETPARCVPKASVSTPRRKGPTKAVALPEKAKNP